MDAPRHSQALPLHFSTKHHPVALVCPTSGLACASARASDADGLERAESEAMRASDWESWVWSWSTWSMR
jgi:hypothetical protein